jgi:hypothetical protein
MSSSKITKNTGPRDSKVRHDKKSKIEEHDDKLKKLEKEHAELVEKQGEDMFTEEDDVRLKRVAEEIEKYNAVMAQVNLNPIPESSAVAEQYTTKQHTPEQNATEQHATEQHATEQHATEQHATEQHTPEQNMVEQNAKDNAPDPVTKHGRIKKERADESKISTNRLMDDLGMVWDVDVGDAHVEPSLRNQEKAAIGHIMRTSQARYCMAYGPSDARSARFESSLPGGSIYKDTRDVTKRSNRIIERIVQVHKDRKEALPMDILSKLTVLLVYWDSKKGIGHTAEVDVLAPDFAERRPHTRCFIYLDPKLYQKYNLENQTGYSHETRSTIKPLMEGNDDWQKSITLHNIAVRLENKFEENCMKGAPGRPEPLCEFVNERKVVSRQTRSRYGTAETSTSRSRYGTAESLASPTPMKLPVSPRQPTPLSETQYKQAPTGAKPGMSLKQRFHTDFLELFDLEGHVTYADLTEQQQLLYPAQFSKWKTLNS